MIDVDTFYKIKQLYHDGHLRVRIAEQLHLDAETVSKWIRRDKYSQRTVPRRSSKLDTYQDVYYRSCGNSGPEQRKDS